MLTHKNILFAFCLIAFPCLLNAQQLNNDSLIDKLDQYLIAANKLHKFNGNVLIAAKEKILFEKSYGYKNIEKQLLNDSNTIFRIGSITKQFTAAIILKLQEEGKLSINDRLDKYFPEFKYARNITLENLLTHTSGIYNYTNDIGAEDSAIVCNPVDKHLVTDIIFKHEPDFKAGTKFSYSNSNYYLLGIIIEKVTGISYEQNFRNIILTPLNMTHTLFDFKHATDSNLATGYQTISDTNYMEAKAWQWDSTVSYAAGAIFSTTGDMYKWATAIAEKKILSPTSWKAMLAPHLEHYGYGIYVDAVYEKQAVFHGGGLPGFAAYLSYYPTEDVTIILLNNKGWFNEGLDKINADLSAIIFNKPYDLTENKVEVKLPVDSLKQFVGQYDFDKKHHVFITLENEQLEMEAPQGGLPKSPLFAKDANTFYLKIIDATIGFEKDDKGNVVSLVSLYNGKKEVCKKVK